MSEVFEPVAASPVLIALTVAFFVTSSIATFDKRLTQAQQRGELPSDEPTLPQWVGLVGWLHWGIGLALLILSWKYVLALFAIKFVLSVLPVLEMVGNVLMSAFRTRTLTPAVRPPVTKPPFNVWIEQQREDEITVQDALDRYTAEYGLVRATPEVPEELARLRAEVPLLEELVTVYGSEAPPELSDLAFRKRTSLAMRENMLEMRQRHAELSRRIEQMDELPPPPVG